MNETLGDTDYVNLGFRISKLKHMSYTLWKDIAKVDRKIGLT